MGRRAWSATSADVSRHGMFLRADDPPRERFLVKLDIELPDGPLEATAFVSRRVERTERSGVGVQFFALSAEAKTRWDQFVATLSGSNADLASPRDPMRAGSSTFLIKLRNVDRMVDFFERNIRKGRVLMNTPLLRDVGSPVALIVIHPDSEREFMFQATVDRVRHEPAKSMELAMDPVTDKIVARFYDFVATGTPTETMDLLINPPDAPAEPTTVDVHRHGDEPIPFAFEVDTHTGDLSIDIEVDADASEELGAASDLPMSSPPRAPLDVVAVRCTACGAFIGAADVEPLPEPLAWVATRRIRYDRFTLQLTNRIEPLDAAGLDAAEVEHLGERIPAAAFVDLARRWREHGGPENPAADLGPAIRRATADLMTGRERSRVDADCPACGEPSLFVSPR
jgi:hypothetical protein